MKFYINNIEKNIEIAPVITETQDKTTDSATAYLEANTDALPYAPRQKCKFVDDDDNEFYFILSSDEVSVFSTSPLLYKHKLNLTQNIKELAFYTERNTSITQPAVLQKKATWSVGISRQYDGDNGNCHFVFVNDCATTRDGVGIKLNLTGKEKCSNAYIKISVYAGITNNNHNDLNLQEITNLAELETLIEDAVPSGLQQNQLLIAYRDANGTHTVNITNAMLSGGTLTDYGILLRCDYIRELINDNGAYDIIVRTRWSGLNYDLPIEEVDSSTHRPIPVSLPDAGLILFKVEVITDVYYYNVYDVLDLLIKRHRKSFNNTSREDLFQLPQSGDFYDLLVNTIAPNFTFTQATLYECLENIFELFDGIFVLDESTTPATLGIEYLNDINKAAKTLSTNNANVSISENRFTNGYVTHYQDARKQESFPQLKSAFAQTGSTELGVPSASDHHFIVPHPINQINKIEVLIFEFTFWCNYPGNDTINTVHCEYPLDITRRVVEEGIWSKLPDSPDIPYNNDVRNVTQYSSVYFAQNDNKIQVAFNLQGRFNWNVYPYGNACVLALREDLGYVYNGLNPNRPQITGPALNPPAWVSVYFRIDYVTTINGKTQIESIENKADGESYIDQYNGAVDLEKMGLNMLGVSLMSGEPRLNATHQITKWENRLQKGDVITYQNELWVANICTYTIFDNDVIQGSIEFVKNFNALSLRTRIAREKRLSNVSSELTQKSEDILLEYIYYSSDEEETITNQTTAFSNANWFFAIWDSFYFDFTVDNTWQNYLSASALINEDNEYIYVPMIKYNAGNCICLEMSLDSPIIAGKQTTEEIGWWGAVISYFTKAIKYTDDYGFLDTTTIHIGEVEILNNSKMITDYPIVDGITGDKITINNYGLYKQPNEIFALNYEICFLPTQINVDFLSQKFIKESVFLSNRPRTEKIYFRYTVNRVGRRTPQYSILDTKAHETSNEVEITAISTSINDDLIFEFDLEEDIVVGSWAIADEKGNLLFSSNRQVAIHHDNNNKGQISIYFYTRHTRI